MKQVDNHTANGRRIWLQNRTVSQSILNSPIDSKLKRVFYQGSEDSAKRVYDEAVALLDAGYDPANYRFVNGHLVGML